MGILNQRERELKHLNVMIHPAYYPISGDNLQCLDIDLHHSSEETMEIVTLAHATLHRVGSTSTYTFSGHREVIKTREVPDKSVLSLRTFVKQLAEENGEPPQGLFSMQQANRLWDYTGEQDTVVFDIQTLNVQYSTPYATCISFPALKVGDRYFKLSEVKL